MNRARTAVIALAVVAWACWMPDGTGAQPNARCFLDVRDVMSFGAYDPMDRRPLNVLGRVSYRCGNTAIARNATGRSAGDVGEKGLTVQISFSAGSAGRYDRYMQGFGDRLAYNLYLDATHTRIWGDGTRGTEVYTANAQPNNTVVIVPVFGQIFPEQDVAAGVYADSIIVTLDF